MGIHCGKMKKARKPRDPFKNERNKEPPQNTFGKLPEYFHPLQNVETLPLVAKQSSQDNIPVSANIQGAWVSETPMLKKKKKKRSRGIENKSSTVIMKKLKKKKRRKRRRRKRNSDSEETSSKNPYPIHPSVSQSCESYSSCGPSCSYSEPRSDFISKFSAQKDPACNYPNSGFHASQYEFRAPQIPQSRSLSNDNSYPIFQGYPGSGSDDSYQSLPVVHRISKMDPVQLQRAKTSYEMYARSLLNTTSALKNPAIHFEIHE